MEVGYECLEAGLSSSGQIQNDGVEATHDSFAWMPLPFPNQQY